MTSLHTESARLGLVTEAIDDLRGGTDESNTSLLNFTREFGILGEEAIARSSISVTRPPRLTDRVPRMNHINTVLKGDANDIVLREVRADRRKTLSDLVGLIGLYIARQPDICAARMGRTFCLWADSRSSYE